MSRSTNVQRQATSEEEEAQRQGVVQELGTSFQSQPSPIRSEAPAEMQGSTALQQQGYDQDDSEVVFRSRERMSNEEMLRQCMARHEAELSRLVAQLSESGDEDVTGEGSRLSRAATPRRASDAAQEHSGTGQEQTVHPSTLTASHRGQQTAQAVTAAQQQEEQPTRAATPARQGGL